MRIADLAREMIRLSGFSTDDIRIEYTGLRPGEKLYEEVVASGENSLPTPHEKLRIARAQQKDRLWLARLNGWLERTEFLDDENVRRELAHWLSDYRAAEAAPVTRALP